MVLSLHLPGTATEPSLCPIQRLGRSLPLCILFSLPALPTLWVHCPTLPFLSGIQPFLHDLTDDDDIKVGRYLPSLDAAEGRGRCVHPSCTWGCCNTGLLEAAPVQLSLSRNSLLMSPGAVMGWPRESHWDIMHTLNKEQMIKGPAQCKGFKITGF